jgi:hypothetical protein
MSIKFTKPQVIVIMDGGLIQEIISDVPLDVTLLDYDTEGKEPEELVTLPRPGYHDQAYPSNLPVNCDPAQVEQILKMFL